MDVAPAKGTLRWSAVFFDAGETLVHPHPTFPGSVRERPRTEGHDVSAETIRERIHVVFDRFRSAAEANELWTTTPEKSRRFWHTVYEIFLREVGVPNGDGLIDRVYAEFTDLANYALFDDVIPVLERLRSAGLTLGVVSNFEEWLERLLERLGVRELFDVRVISGIEVEKPDPHLPPGDGPRRRRAHSLGVRWRQPRSTSNRRSPSACSRACRPARSLLDAPDRGLLPRGASRIMGIT